VRLSLRMSQSRPLYEAFQALRDGPVWSKLTPAQQRIVTNELRDFVLGGVALEGEVRCARLRIARIVYRGGNEASFDMHSLYCCASL
jgi:Zn-dependent oligopeptidase